MTKKRDLEEIKVEFSNLCFETGKKQYELYLIQRDLNLLNEQLQDLNFEVIKLQALEKEGK